MDDVGVDFTGLLIDVEANNRIIVVIRSWAIDIIDGVRYSHYYY
jgi:hypothetical protein